MDLVVLASHEREFPIWNDHLLPWLIVGVMLVIAVVIGYANYQNARPFRLESSSSLSPEAVLNTLQAQMARDGWALGFRDASSLVMSADRNARLGSTLAIGCISVWLALLHLVGSRARMTVEIDVSSTTEGSLIVTNGSRSGDGVLRYIARQLDALPNG